MKDLTGAIIQGTVVHWHPFRHVKFRSHSRREGLHPGNLELHLDLTTPSASHKSIALFGKCL